MDVLINWDSDFKTVIEFNSYRFWNNAGASLYDWVTDASILYDITNVTSPDVRVITEY